MNQPLAQTPNEPRPLPFLVGGGEMGARIRAFDWASTPLGSPESWPYALRSALSICLNSSFPTAIYWGPELQLLYNDAWAPIPAEKHPWALGRPAREVWSDIWDVLESQFRQVLERRAGVTAFDQMLPMERAGSAQETYWNYSLTPILDEDGRVAGVFNQGHETTEQVRTRRERQAQIDRLREMFEQAPGAVALLSGPQHVFEIANDAYVELIGGRQVLGKPIAEGLPEMEAQGFIALLDRVFETGEPYIGRNVRVQLRRGSEETYKEKVVDFIYQPIRSDGIVTGIFVQASDVTDRTLAEASLRESEERFRLVAESAPVMLWMGDANGRCVYLNRAQREFWGVALEDVPDFEWGSTLHPEDRERLYEPFNRGMRAHEAFNVEARFLRADGEYRTIATRASPRFAADGTFVGMIGVNVDVTEARQAESALQSLNATLEQRVNEEVARRSQVEHTLHQMQKMEAIGQLTGGIAHDFNNMLAVVIGGLNLMRRRLARGDTNVASYIDGALEGAQRAAALTQRLLAFARRQPLEPVFIDVNRMIAEMLEMLRRTLGESIRIDTHFAFDVWTLRADRNQLESVLLNLAVNARDAMKGSGRLTIRTANVALNEGEALRFGVQAGDYVLMTVSDIGCGMTPEVSARAFDPFFTTKAVGEGTGLGLSQVFGFVNQSGGHVRIDSEVGRGTTVSVYLPRSDGHVQMSASRAPVSVRGGHSSEIILVVEDEPRVRSFSAEALADLGYTVQIAGSAAEALQMIEAGQRFTLLFTDIVMPDMSGWDLAQAAAEKLPDLKIVFTSGYSGDASERESRDPAGRGILTKPFSVEQLAKRIRDALDSVTPATMEPGTSDRA